ncbi:MAG: fibronectin type III domain-containing protein [Thermoplasmatota archaeon]
MLLASLAIIFTVDPGAADTEPNDTIGSAESIIPGYHSGSVDDISDYDDYYRFSAGGGDIIQIEFTSNSVGDPLYLYLYDQEESELFMLESEGGNSTSDQIYTANETEVSTWYIHVEYYGVGTYEFELTITTQDDGGTGGDAGGSQETAIGISPGTSIGHINNSGGSLDEEDWYKFQAGEGDMIFLEFTSYSEYYLIYCYLLDPMNNSLIDLESLEGDSSTGDYFTSGETNPGWYYVRIEAYGTGDYDFDLVVQKQNDAESGNDAEGEQNDNITIDQGSFRGALGDLDEADTFRTPMLNSMVIEVNFTSETQGTQHLFLYDNNWTLLSSGPSSSSESFMIVYCLQETYGGIWGYVHIDGDKGNYSFSLNTWVQNDAGTGQDAYSQAHTFTEATIIAEQNYTGYVDERGDTTDVYRTTVGAGGILNITIKGPEGAYLNAWLKRMDGTNLGTISTQGSTELFHIEYNFSMMETVAIMLFCYSGNGTYQLSLMIEGSPVVTAPSDPVGVTATATSQGIVLAWSPPPSDGGSPITKYNIYRGLSFLEPKSFFGTVGPSTFNFTDTMTFTNITYYYYVTAENAMGESGGSSLVNAVALPILTSGDADGDGMNDTWEESYGLNKYDPNDKYEDMDGDGFSNYEEFKEGTNPLDPTSYPSEGGDWDQDGIPNTWEIEYGFDPEDPTDANGDPDNDQRTNLQEYLDGTNPLLHDNKPDIDDDDITIDDDDDTDGWSWTPIWICGILFLICVPILIVLIILLLVLRSKGRKEEKEE